MILVEFPSYVKTGESILLSDPWLVAPSIWPLFWVEFYCSSICERLLYDLWTNLNLSILFYYLRESFTKICIISTSHLNNGTVFRAGSICGRDESWLSSSCTGGTGNGRSKLAKIWNSSALAARPGKRLVSFHHILSRTYIVCLLNSHF